MTSPPDPAARVSASQRQLRATLQQRGTLGGLVRDTLGETDPRRIAELLIDRFASWVPLAGWAVVAVDARGGIACLSRRGGGDEWWGSLMEMATLVMQQRTVVVSGNAATDPRIGGPAAVTAVAFCLSARGRPVGAVVGVDRPSGRAPRFGQTVIGMMGEVLETGGMALDQAHRLQRAEAMSVTDDLTGLYNSRFLRESLRREAKRAIRYGRPVTVLFIDLDGFKSVNDVHGHLAGSRTLVEAGAIIRTSARESDIVARYGGDEFVVVLPDTSSEGGLVVARRIRERIGTCQFLAADGLDIRLTASIGVATLPDTARSYEELLDAADKAMYHVKESGKNNISQASQV